MPASPFSQILGPDPELPGSRPGVTVDGGLGTPMGMKAWERASSPRPAVAPVVLDQRLRLELIVQTLRTRDRRPHADAPERRAARAARQAKRSQPR